MRGKIVLTITILTLGIIVLTYFYVFKDTETDISEEKAEHKLSAIELFYKFEDDENQANKLYLGKIIEITGTIVSIQETGNKELMLIFKEKSEVFGVSCTLEGIELNRKLIENGKKRDAQGGLSGLSVRRNFNKLCYN